MRLSHAVAGILLGNLAHAQLEQITPWVTVEGASCTVIDGVCTERNVSAHTIEPFYGQASQLRGVQAEIAWTTIDANGNGVKQPFLYSIENRHPSADVLGYTGTYGGIPWIYTTRRRYDGGPTRLVNAGFSMSIGMCGGQYLTAYDGVADFEGTSAHTNGAGQMLEQTNGLWNVANFYAWTGDDALAGLYCSGTPAGPLCVSIVPEAYGFVSDWQSASHPAWNERWQIDGAEYRLQIRYHYLYAP